MSDAYLTEEHIQLRAQVGAFAQTEIAPRVKAMEAAPTSFDRELAALIARQGWIGATIDPAYGGMGVGHLAKTIIIEEICKISGAMGAMLQASQLGAAKIIHYGSEEQKRTWLPPIAEGSCLPTIAVTEPASGGHVLGMQATGRRRGKHYLLSGHKVFVGNSHIGHVHGVVVRTRPGSRGLTAFLVEAGTPGLALAPYQPTMGLRGFSFGELLLDNCRVPVTNMIGEEGDGLAIAYSSSILYGRPNLTAVALGLHQAIVDETVRFATERTRYGAPLAEMPTIKQKLGALQSRLMTARLTAYHAVRLLDDGQPCDPDLINSKHVNVQAARESASEAMDIHAAAGLQTDRPLERLFRDVQHTWAPAGTGDIQLHRLAETLLSTSQSQWSKRLASVRSGAERPSTSCA
ncbi:acyl-CoA dehydrogenase family protein [Streptomyces galbus]|uniref:acyl-CoA dehydrogenase family protein n=1 Tax=Streptomyces galbus TaxID=33898 RepID=UPI0038111C42